MLRVMQATKQKVDISEGCPEFLKPEDLLPRVQEAPQPSERVHRRYGTTEGQSSRQGAARIQPLATQQRPAATAPAPAGVTRQSSASPKKATEFLRTRDRFRHGNFRRVRNIQVTNTKITGDIYKSKQQFRDFLNELENTGHSPLSGLAHGDYGIGWRIVTLEFDGISSFFICFSGLKDTESAEKLNRRLYSKHKKDFRPPFRLCFEIGDTHPAKGGGGGGPVAETLRQWSRYTLCGALATRQQDGKTVEFTIGGLIEIDGESWALTCIHDRPRDSIEEQEAPRGPQNVEEGEEDEDEEPASPIDPANIIIPDASTSEPDKPGSSAADKGDFGAFNEAIEIPISNLFGPERHGVEWSLYRVDDPRRRLPNCSPNVTKTDGLGQHDRAYLTSWAGEPIEGPVHIMCGTSGLMPATMFPNESDLRLGPRRILEVWRIQFPKERGPKPGDSGSWVVDIKTGTVFGHLITIFQDIGYVLPIRDIVQQIKTSKGFEAASFDFPSPYEALANASCALPAIPNAEKLTEEALVPQVRRQSRQSRAVQALDRVSDPSGILDKSTRKILMGIIARFGADFPSHEDEMENDISIFKVLFDNGGIRRERETPPQSKHRSPPTRPGHDSHPGSEAPSDQNTSFDHSPQRNRDHRDTGPWDMAQRTGPGRCPSSAWHEDSITNISAHYLGCVPFSLRDRYLCVQNYRQRAHIKKLHRIQYLRSILVRDEGYNLLIQNFSLRMRAWREAWRGGSANERLLTEHISTPLDYDPETDFSGFVIRSGTPFSETCDLEENVRSMSVKRILDDARITGTWKAPNLWRYYHLPANHMKWAEVSSPLNGRLSCLSKLADFLTNSTLQSLILSLKELPHDTSGYRIENGFATPVLATRYWRSNQRNTGRLTWMRPFSGLTEPRPNHPQDLVLLMPYLDFEPDMIARRLLVDVENMKATYPRRKDQMCLRLERETSLFSCSQEPLFPAKRSPLGQVLMLAAKVYLAMDTYPERQLLRDSLGQQSLHTRRAIGPESLVQEGIFSTRHSELLGKIKTNIVPLVSELWLWVIDGHAVVTCFPKQHGYLDRSSDIRLKIKKRIIRDLEERCSRTCVDVALITIEECVNSAFQWRGGQFLEVYRRQLVELDKLIRDLETTRTAITSYSSRPFESSITSVKLRVQEGRKVLRLSSSEMRDMIETIDRQSIALQQFDRNIQRMNLEPPGDCSSNPVSMDKEQLRWKLESIYSSVESNRKELTELLARMKQADETLKDLSQQINDEISQPKTRQGGRSLLGSKRLGKQLLKSRVSRKCFLSKWAKKTPKIAVIEKGYKSDDMQV